MRESNPREHDHYGSSSERFYNLNRLISSSLMKRTLYDRALTSSHNDFQSRTQR